LSICGRPSAGLSPAFLGWSGKLVIPVARKLWQHTGVLTPASRARRWIILSAAYRVIRWADSSLVLPTADRNSGSRFRSQIPTVCR
jgi:hypothetical protein